VLNQIAAAALNHNRRADLLSQACDPSLQMGLGLLGGVIFAVLLEVTPLTRGLDARGDL